MATTADFRNGLCLEYNNGLYTIVQFQHVKPGKGGAFVRTKMKNLITSRALEETFRSGEKFSEPDLENKTMQYLYADDLYHFMDQESFEQRDFGSDQIESVKKYLKELENYNVLFFEDKPIAVEPPMFMVLKVAETKLLRSAKV